MRGLAIHTLIAGGIPITESKIQDMITRISANKTVDDLLLPEAISDELVEDIALFLNKEIIEVDNLISDIAEYADAMPSKIVQRFDLLESNIAIAMDSMRAAQATERNMSGVVDTYAFDFTDKTIINDATSCKVADNILVGISNDRDFADREKIQVRQYDIIHVKAFINTDDILEEAKIEVVDSNGLPALAAGHALINGTKAFILSKETTSSGQKNIELLIDKQDYDEFNQIEIKLHKAHLANLYTSIDGITFDKVLDKKKYVKNTVIPIKNSNARYIKLVFLKKNFDIEKNSKYLYKVQIDQINITKYTVDNKTVFESNVIPIDKALTCIGMSTCDNSQDSNIDIIYKLSINGGDWQSIRPAAKLDKHGNIAPAVLYANSMIDNKLIVLQKKTQVNQSYRYDLDIPTQFIRSNLLRAFKPFKKAEWAYRGGYYEITGFTNKRIGFECGDTLIEINGRLLSGTISLDPGIYKIRTSKANYKSIYNAQNAEVISSNGAELHLKAKDGRQFSVIDPLFPFNHKHIVENSFEELFESELIENKDYTIYNNGLGYNLFTTAPHDEVIITYRLQQSFIDSIRLRIEFQSLNGTSIPYTEKVILRFS